MKESAKKAVLLLLTVLFGFAALGGILCITDPQLSADSGILIPFTLIFALVAALLLRQALKGPKFPPSRRSAPEPEADLVYAAPDHPPMDAFPDDERGVLSIRLPNSELNLRDAEMLKFWSKKRTDFVIPPYYASSSFGRNVAPALSQFLADGYLRLGDGETRVSLYTVPELKAVLSARKLKVSGKKDDLVRRILENLSPQEIEAAFPVNAYVLTDKGRDALAPYSILDASDSHGLSFSHYRLIREKAASPHEEDCDILLRMLFEDLDRYHAEGAQESYQITAGHAARFLREIDRSEDAFECSAVSYFLWVMTLQSMQQSPPPIQAYHMAKGLEQSAVACGYSLEQMLSFFPKAVERTNPFSLATSANIALALQFLKDSLGLT